MSGQEQVSLSDQVSKKISLWVLVLVVAITLVVCFVSFLQSRQMFLKQVESWETIIPQQAITNLMDSDYFSIRRQINLVKSTGLFSSFLIADNQKKEIARFGNDKVDVLQLIPIRDSTNSVWGYYFSKPDYYKFSAPFLFSASCFLLLIVTLYGLIRWRIRSNLNYEFSHFNQFLREIELLTEKISEVYQDDNLLPLNHEKSKRVEQVIINKAIGCLISEIKKSNQSLRTAILAAEQKRFQEELTETALQVVHDIGSPIATLETIIQSE